MRPPRLYLRLRRRFAPGAPGISRREALKTAMAASVGLLLSGAPACISRTRSRGSSARRVLIVGGGFSGLACAHELRAAGHDVRILEARSRVGGRVLSFRDFVPGGVVEGGGELIGSNHATWMGFAQLHGLEFLDVTEDENVSFPVTLEGRRLPDDEVEALCHGMDSVFARMTDDARPVEAERPWETPGAGALDALSTSAWLARVDASPLVKRAIAATLAADNGVPLERQSLLGNLASVKGGGLERYWTDSEVHRCAGGNDRLARALAGAIGPERILLGTPVVRIDDEGPVARVVTADGTVHEADEVVLAVPPSTWSKIDIRPALPATLAGGAIQMGTNVKWLARLDSRFWLGSSVGPGSMSDGEISETWEGTDNQKLDRGAALVAFSGADAAERCRAFPTASRDGAYLDRLAAVYAGIRGRFVEARFMDWPGDPWTLAGYSFAAPGSILRIGPPLHAGIGRLRFAGEHTSFAFPGYMEGALESGVRVAKAIHEV